MAYLLFRDDAQGWRRYELPPQPVLLSAGESGLDAIACVQSPTSGSGAGLLETETFDPRALAVVTTWRGANGPRRHAVIAAHPGMPLHLNGTPVATGLVCLSNHDCLRLGPAVLFYDAFTQPRPERCSNGSADQPCAFCRDDLVVGDMVVVCPTCGMVYHHGEAESCWLVNACCICGQFTALEGDPCWLPSGFPKGGSHA
jgi:hypothetical protein